MGGVGSDLIQAYLCGVYTTSEYRCLCADRFVLATSPTLRTAALPENFTTPGLSIICTLNNHTTHVMHHSTHLSALLQTYL